MTDDIDPGEARAELDQITQRLADIEAEKRTLFARRALLGRYLTLRAELEGERHE